MRLTRRTFGKTALAGLPLARADAGANTFYKGVQLGICSYSFRTMGLDELIRQMRAVPMGQLELESVFIEPATGAGRGQTPEQREAQRRWRLTVPLDDIRAIRRRLDEAGIDVYAYNIPINNTFSEEELDRVFRIARLLGAQAVNSATTLNVVPMLAAAAEQHNMRVGLHPSSGAPGGPVNPDAIGTGDSYRKAFAISPRIGANPDLNGFRAWGPDPTAFLREIAGRITTMHTHDSKMAEPRPVAVPFGQGNNPLREVLRLMQEERLTFVAMLERTYNLPDGGDNVAELRGCLRFCQEALS
jgi:sugar phosphate isomerase/epimerase